MKTKNHMFYFILLLILIGPIWTGLCPRLFWSHWVFQSLQLHSAIEAVGALASVMMAVFLLQRGREDAWKVFPMATGFISMGILDGFHAVTIPGRGFVLLHSAAGFAGGLGFALAWLPRRAFDNDAVWKRWLPISVAATSISFGVYTLFYRETLPVMVQDGVFTGVAVAINFAAGVLFIAAAARFLLDFHRSGNIETYLFAGMSFLFGSSGLMFKYSMLWNDSWWVWHAYRLTAYLLVLGVIIRGYAKTLSSLSIALEERRLAEETLKKNEEQLRIVTDTLPVLISYVDVEQRYQFCNKAYEEWFGHPRTELYGKHLKEVLGEAAYKIIQDYAETALSGKRVIFESEVAYKDGGRRYVSATYIPDFGEHGKVNGFFALVGDITERRRTEKKLQDAERQYRVLFEQSPDGIVVIDVETQLPLIFNEKAYLHLGYPEEEFAMLRISDYEVLEKPEETKARIGKIMREGHDAFETKHRMKNGNIRDVFVNVQLLKILDKPVLHCIFHDITERKKAEGLMHESEERYKRLVESTTNYIYTVKVENGKVVSTTHGPGCVSVTGYISEEYAADPYLWYKMVYEEDKKAVMRQAERILSEDAVPPLEHRIIHKDGSIRWVKNTPVPRYNKEEKFIGYDGLIADITEEKKLEDQLRHAQKLEAVGQLAGGIAHDFNNILTAIIGYSSLLKMKMRGGDPLLVNVDNILVSAERAANLTQSLLTFSRKQISNLSPVDLNKVVDRVEKLLLRLISEDIELKTILADKDLIVMADSGQIEQVIMNLVTNARDAMPAGGLLTIETTSIELDMDFLRKYENGAPGVYALISISDSGTGMDENTIRRIFEPFFTTKEVGKGTGLGLAMVYGIVKQHNGYIDCYSELGKGTTFKLYLPMVKAEKGMEHELTETTGLLAGSERVLLAEDETEVRQMTKQVLEEFGYEVIEAVDGWDAVGKFMENKDRIDILLLDVVMPKMDGKKVYERIKEVRPDIKVIFASGYTSDFIRKKEIIDRGLNFVVKPISPKKLLQKIREVLDK